MAAIRRKQGAGNDQRILIYGFGPYDEFEHNITMDVITALPSTPNVHTTVFTTRFDRGMFERCLARHRPAMIIGLGQHRHARKLRLERRAINRMAKRGQRGRRIERGGPLTLAVNLRLPSTAVTTVAYDAGTYVCNYSMYVMLRYCAAHSARFAFIHISKRYEVSEAVAYLQRAIQGLSSAPFGSV